MAIERGLNLMIGLGESVAQRVRWVFLFAAFLISVAILTPVLASATDSPSEAEPDLPLPDEQVVTNALADSFREYREAEEERAKLLSSPAAVDEREASRDAYADLGPGQAEDLLLIHFGSVLAALDKDPARFLSDAKLNTPLGEDAATVTSEGDTQLLEAGLPVRTEDDVGNLKKVDLSLEREGSAWEPANPLVDLKIGHTAEEGIEIGESGVEVVQVGAEDSAARVLEDTNLFYGEVEEGEDTDLIVSPTSTGVEVFNMLRSAESPERIRFEVDVPAGAELRAAPGGSAEVIDEAGETLVVIAKPTAVDAQGTNVPVTMTVESGSVTLTTDHRNERLAYPILVDPAIYQDWGWWYEEKNLTGLGAWQWQTTPGNWWVTGGTSTSGYPQYAGKGLFIATAPGSLGASQWGQFLYSAPNSHSYLADATINPFWRNNRNCPSPNPYYQPYDYAGMWNETSWNSVQYNKANEQGWVTMGTWGRTFAVGMSTSGGTYIPCWRELMLGGVGIWLDDWSHPIITSVGATPTGWVKKDGTPRNFSVTAMDEGLGVRVVRMFGVGTPEWQWSKGWCAGTYEQRCPNSATGTITYTTNGFPYEGRYDGQGKERGFTIQAKDPVDRHWTIERALWLDGLSPTVRLDDQLAIETKQVGGEEKPQGEGDDELSFPTYKLTVEAEDGTPSDPRSGVKEIRLFLDDQKDPIKILPGTCTTSGCPSKLILDYTLELADLSPGQHSLRIVAVDQVGNESDPNRNILFKYIPSTGMKDQFVMQHFRLPDGNDHSGEAEYQGPEIAVNVVNGNVVFHQRDLDLTTERAGVGIERTYNSQLPEERDSQWGEGWELAQEPELDPVPGSPDEAIAVQAGQITGVDVPNETSQTTFSSKIGATIEKTAYGFEVDPVSSDEVSVFDEAGRIEAVRFGDDVPPDQVAGEPVFNAPISSANFGSPGTGPGQYATPSDVATDPAGNVWVLDRGNNRVQKLGPGGEVLLQFGALGSGDGQFNSPTAIALDASGDLWITDQANHRVQHFSPAGQFISKFGTYGINAGKLWGPNGIAIGADGTVWVSDVNKVQRFTPAGEFIERVGSGQVAGPQSLVPDAAGNVLVAEATNNRISTYDKEGDFVRSFGSAGSGAGQLSAPTEIDLDKEGHVWVADSQNRVQLFTGAGDHLASFGAAGSGQGQFSFDTFTGISVEDNGRVWITDSGNSRVQRWAVPGTLASAGSGEGAPGLEAPVANYEYEGGDLTGIELEDAISQEEPALDFDLDGGLVSEIDGDGVESVSYDYDEGVLTAVESEAGETHYTMDSEDRLTGVELPNGTTATVVYDSASRATKVTVDPAGPEPAQSTSFAYSTSPRRTTVWGGGNPEIHYLIGDDGSVFEWAYAAMSPKIEPLSGSLVAKAGQMIENKDHTLFITGDSPHGIGSIKVIANGSAVVGEESCTEPEPPDDQCDQWTFPWVTHASAHAAGRLDVEVVVTDLLGRKSAERFFVFVPQQPPPDPEAPEVPDFQSIKQFREDYGLDRGKSLSSAEQTELILELLYEWERADSTAVAAVQEWGVPMRAAELAEMAWRRLYIDRAAEVIPAWATEHAPTTYGGFYVDDRAGGEIYVGFVGSISAQQALVDALKADPRLLAAEKFFAFPTPPAHAIQDLESFAPTVGAALRGNPEMAPLVSSVRADPERAKVTVGALTPNTVRSFLIDHFGAGAPIEVHAQEPYYDGASRYAQSGPVRAGSALVGLNRGPCTAGFGSRVPVGMVRGQTQFKALVLTAGHCYPVGEAVMRQSEKFGAGGRYIGDVLLSGYQGSYVVDGAGIWVDESLRSHAVLNGVPLEAQSIQGDQGPNVTKRVCWSAIYSGRRCGTFLFTTELTRGGLTKDVYVFKGLSIEGDSGGPVWDPESHKAVGLITGATADGGGKCWIVFHQERACTRMYFTPLRPGGGSPGVIPTLGVEVLKERG